MLVQPSMCAHWDTCSYFRNLARVNQGPISVKMFPSQLENSIKASFRDSISGQNIITYFTHATTVKLSCYVQKLKQSIQYKSDESNFHRIRITTVNEMVPTLV